MSTFKKFTDIEAWQKARVLTASVYRITRKGPLARDFGLRDQMCRASVSIMANIAEGFDRGGNREFVQFLAIAKGSASELISHLYVALDATLIDQGSFDQLRGDAEEVCRMLAGLMRYLAGSPIRSAKYKLETRTSKLEPETRP